MQLPTGVPRRQCAGQIGGDKHYFIRIQRAESEWRPQEEIVRTAFDVVKELMAA